MTLTGSRHRKTKHKISKADVAMSAENFLSDVEDL
jgi:hypothetical protein